MSDAIVVSVISVVLGGGLIGGIVAFIKVRPESSQILVNTARDVVLIQRDAMTDLQQRLTDVEAERDKLRARVGELETKVATLQQQMS